MDSYKIPDTKPDKTIFIEMTERIDNAISLSYDMVKEELQLDDPIFDSMYTHCTTFFTFDTLLSGWNVVVRRTVNGKKGEIDLYDLLHTKGDGYVESGKEIRWAHNVHKMLLAGMFTFK